MRAGRLRERITIEARASSGTGFVQALASWVPLVSGRSAEIKPMGGSEPVIAERLNGKNLCEIRLRWNTDVSSIDTTMRVKNDRTSQIYNIRAVQNTDMRNRFITLMCDEGVDRG